MITTAPPPHLRPTESSPNRGSDVSLDAIPCRRQHRQPSHSQRPSKGGRLQRGRHGRGTGPGGDAGHCVQRRPHGPSTADRAHDPGTKRLWRAGERQSRCGPQRTQRFHRDQRPAALRPGRHHPHLCRPSTAPGPPPLANPGADRSVPDGCGQRPVAGAAAG